MHLLPASSSTSMPRLATIHTNINGQRVLQVHALNIGTKSLESEDLDKTSAFLPNSGVVLADPDSQLMIPVATASVEGLIIIGQDSARFIHTGRPSHNRILSPTAIPALPNEPSTTISDMAIDETAASPGIGQGKGKAKESSSSCQLSQSPENVLQISASPPTNASSRRRSSVGFGTSPPGGSKRKLSESANSSGRGKGSLRKETRPILCNLPISQYTA